ncbi:hypothetical protein Vafri_12282 [Volvox africanus]|uniref:Peptidase S8/S53 domain-containing protein n=1 Tax=Volvox africanus TaxID=51714 RepID=A0A8J4BEI3_9CHLO|nr:hypothetical protein Vafri_12282 [Volvox africanus]
MTYDPLDVCPSLSRTSHPSPTLQLVLRESPNMPLLASVIPSGKFVEVVVADPITACTPLNNVAQVAGRIVLVLQSNSCSISDQGLNVLAAKGAAMIIVQNKADKPYGPSLTDIEVSQYTVQIPISMTYKYFGDTLLDFLTSGYGRLFVAGVVVPVDVDTVAEFSSWGPIYGDGRIKPDIIAPGKDIISAVTSLRFGSFCEYDRYWGTSAATPLVAGTIIIMRQYLRTGFYPLGARNNILSTPFTPSGMLLKALLIAGAKSLEGGVARATGKLMGPPPDGYQGWGRLSMSGSLPLEGFTDPRVRLQVLDRGQFTLPGQSVTVTGLVATGTGPISIVLAYYDYPADVNAVTALVNNLDLIVVANGRNYTGNNDEHASAAPVPDSVNTVEKVLLKSLQPGANVSIVVAAPSLPSLILDPTTPQRWAVAVVGHFSGYLESELNPFWAKWGRGMPPSPPPPEPPRPPRPPPSPVPSPAPPRPPPAPPSPRPPPRPPKPPRLPPSPPTPPSTPPTPPPSNPRPPPSPPFRPTSPSPPKPSLPDVPMPPSLPGTPRAPSPPSPQRTPPLSPPPSPTPSLKSPPRPPSPVKPPPTPRRPPSRPPSPPRRPPNRLPPPMQQ